MGRLLVKVGDIWVNFGPRGYRVLTEWLHRFNKIPFNSIEDFFYIYFDSKITFICFRFVNEMQEFLSSNNVISSSYGWKKQ